MVKAGGPDEPIGTSSVPGFDIRCRDREIRFGFHPIEKMTKVQDHTIILKLAAIAELGAQERFEVVLQFLVIDPQHGKENQTILSFDKDLLIAGVLF